MCIEGILCVCVCVCVCVCEKTQIIVQDNLKWNIVLFLIIVDLWKGGGGHLMFTVYVLPVKQFYKQKSL